MAKKHSITADKEKTSLFMRKEYIRALKYISFMSEKTHAEIVDEALTNYLKDWELLHGPIPKKI